MSNAAAQENASRKAFSEGVNIEPGNLSAIERNKLPHDLSAVVFGLPFCVISAMCELSLARLGGEISEFGSTEERQLLSVVESVLQLVQDKLEEEFAIPAEDGRPSSRALSEQPLHFLRLKCAETLEKKCQSILSSHMTRQDVSAFVRSFLHTLAWGRDFDTKTWEEEEDDEREDGSMSSLFPAVKVPCLQRTLFRAMHSPLFSFSLPLLLLSANPMDKLSKVAMPLLKVFELYSPSLPLSSFSSTGYRVGFLARVIEREIASTESLETVLRTNSVTTKLLDGVSGLPEVAAFRKKILGDIIEVCHPYSVALSQWIPLKTRRNCFSDQMPVRSR